MRTISAPVGAGVKALNRCDDVRTIQEMLNEISPENGGAKTKLKVDGKCGDKTKGAIQQFQLRHFGWKLADGRVDPGRPTWIRMNECSGGPATWAKNTLFRIRRQQPDSMVSRQGIADVFEIQDQQHHRRAMYLFASSRDVVLPPATQVHVQGSWGQLTSTRPLAIFELDGPATLISTAPHSGPTKLKDITTTLTVTKPTALVTGLLPFVVEVGKQGYLQCWFVYD